MTQLVLHHFRNEAGKSRKAENLWNTKRAKNDDDDVTITNDDRNTFNDDVNLNGDDRNLYNHDGDLVNDDT